MFAVIRTGGKQYKVAPNNIIEVEKLDAEIGSTILINDLVLFNDGSADHVDSKKFEGVSVSAEVLNQKKGEKILVFKKKRRHNYRRKNGHRQPITVLKIAEIGKGLTAKSAPEAKETKAKAPKAEAKTEAKKEAASKKKTTTTKAKKA